MTDRIPLGLLAELSHRCPLKCPYCSNPEMLVRKGAELVTKDWVRVFSEAAELGVLQVHLSGGEPTVRPDLEELVEAAEDAGLYTNLITSGVLLTRGRLAELKRRGLQHVQLSVQSASTRRSEAIGGLAGAQAKKMQCAQWTRELDLPLTVNVVIHRQNIDEVDAVIDWACDLGAERLEIAHTQYLGWALTNRDALMPTEAQVFATNRLVARRTEELRGQLSIDYVVPDYYGVRPKACMGGWGRQFLVIAPDGTALPCHGAGELDHLTFENVRHQSLKWIWEESPSFEVYRGTAWMPEPCQSCERREIDWGGCRCQAFALTGDATRPDPVCALSENHWRVEAARRGSLAPTLEKVRASEPAWMYRQYS